MDSRPDQSEKAQTESRDVWDEDSIFTDLPDALIISNIHEDVFNNSDTKVFYFK